MILLCFFQINSLFNTLNVHSNNCRTFCYNADAQDTRVEMYERAAEGNKCWDNEKDGVELQVLRLAEELRAALEFLDNKDQLEELRSQVPDSTAMVLQHWLQQRMVSLQIDWEG